MSRITITEDINDIAPGQTPRVLGWFESSKARYFPMARRYSDGNDRTTGTDIVRTAQGRWVSADWSRWEGGKTTYRYIDEQHVRDWFLMWDMEEEYRECFGPIPEEAGPTSPGAATHACDELCGDDTHPRDGRTYPTSAIVTMSVTVDLEPGQAPGDAMRAYLREQGVIGALEADSVRYV